MKKDISNKDKSSSKTSSRSIKRRDILKGFAAVPVLGAFSYAWLRKSNIDEAIRNQMREVVSLTSQPVDLAPNVTSGDPIRLGIIGFGIRGKQLMRAAGFAEPSWIDEAKKAHAENKTNRTYEDFMNQDQLNMVVNGVCDIFTVYSKAAAVAASNVNREGTGGNMGDRKSVV